MAQTPRKNRLLYVILAIFIQVSFLPAQAQALCMVKRSLGLSCCQRHASAETSGHAEVMSCCAKRALGSFSKPTQKKGDHPRRRQPCTCEHRLPDATSLPDGPLDLNGPTALVEPLQAFGWFQTPFELQNPIHPVAPRARTGPSLNLLYQVSLV